MTSLTKQSSNQTSLFQVYLRLRPPITKEEAAHAHRGERYLTVEPPEPTEDDNASKTQSRRPTHITLQPPNDSRKRAVEKFAFTRVFEEDSKQLEVFENTGVPSLIQGVLKEGRDGLVATLGVTGSGKSHTILGSKHQRGITQMSLDVLFRSLGNTIRSADNFEDPTLLASLSAADSSEAQLFSARNFIHSIYGDPSERGRASRAQTPMSRGQTPLLESTSAPLLSRRYLNQRLNALPSVPHVSHLTIPIDTQAEYVVVVSMYEVYNDRIFDLLSPSPVSGTASRQGNGKEKRRPLLFKSTEGSPDRKIVAGLRKVVCSTYEEAMTVLETGLTERRIAGTGSNNASSRSHGFFCLEVKKKVRGRRYGEISWAGNTLTVVDLAGSERARNARTAGATLAEAGKINESLMYLGQCLQMQSDFSEGNKNKTVVPYRQCKLTELLFSNSFPSSHSASHNRYPQKAVMIVTADPLGDFNATSQILRYSALAREVTVPRIPSVSSTILSSSASTQSRPQTSNGRNTPYAAASTEDLQEAAREIVRITDDYEALIVRLAEEEIARQEAELKLQAAEGRCLMIEQEIREECCAEMDEKMEEERKRWQEAMDRQAGHHEEHLDNKLEIASRGIKIYEDPEPTADERVDELERENEYLRSKLAALERQLNTQTSPTRKPKPRAAPVRSGGTGFGQRLVSGDSSSDLENMFQRVTAFKVAETYKSPVKPKAALVNGARNPRRVTSRKKDLGPEDDI
ncbi:kinesin family protein [Talaromyces stipitatus ATCC 10500]|uniref:Kinesin family protein n=1 Tax=Talaromyces stipitatus (strain ATCC 10500 / CBS 375.48 / QM 6759 / NRRL 1006) TaxID=441959 RepID=B8M5J0_TALSN|nr:kinesin family protein [Talaromyces stipitatus ATCC 10500]EED19884.1 kinesin family protein [Talaromyces stipitatus ATCC 10500]